MTRQVKQHSAAQRGFTIVELLVVLGIIGILSAIGLESISEIRESVLKATNERTALEALTSLEAGQIDNDSSDFHTAGWLKGNELWSSGDTTQFAPGISGNGNMYLQVTSDGIAQGNSCPLCSQYEVYVRHCGGTTAFYYARFANGTEIRQSFDDNWSC